MSQERNLLLFIALRPSAYICRLASSNCSIDLSALRFSEARPLYRRTITKAAKKITNVTIRLITKSDEPPGPYRALSVDQVALDHFNRNCHFPYPNGCYRVLTMVSSLQKAPTSDSDSERTLYDCPDRTSQADQADSRHDSRSEIFSPYAPPFFSIISALTSSTQQPQVASLQPIEETKWQRPLVLPTLNAHRRLVSLIIALTFLSGGLVAGWIAFVIHQNHILLGEESPDNEGKDDDQELNPLILLIDAVFIILYVLLNFLLLGTTLRCLFF